MSAKDTSPEIIQDPIENRSQLGLTIGQIEERRQGCYSLDALCSSCNDRGPGLGSQLV